MMSIKGLGRKVRVALTAGCVSSLAALAPGFAQDAGKAPIDEFHPDQKMDATPLYGGTVIVHTASMPKHMSYPTENSAVTRRVLYEVHETLLRQDWESHKYVPNVAQDFVTEDMVILKEGAAAKYADGVMDLLVADPNSEAGEHVTARIIYGKVAEHGETYMVTPMSRGALLTEPLEVAREDVARVELGTVMTFYLRNDVKWQPYTFESGEGASVTIADQKVDARDCLFSYELYSNPAVDCDEKRPNFNKVTRAEIVDNLTIRYFADAQYYAVESLLGVDMTIMPTHVYDLSDPDNPAYKEGASAAMQADVINNSPSNRMWIGVGPYRVTEYSSSWITVERYNDYFDKERAGYFDKIRWRHIDDDTAAINAALNGELDFFDRVKSTDYFGELTQKPEFTNTLYKGYRYLGTYGFTVWNMYKPQLAEKEVRQALAHAFDFDTYLRDVYKNLARQVTGPFPFESAAYDHDVKPYAYDLDLAIEMLEDAGWYDRDGDDIVDKDGVQLTIDFMMPSGNDASETFGLKLQEQFGKIGVKVTISSYDWATFLERLKSRDFDSANLAWVPSLESDPEPLWGSKWGEFDVEGSNNAGVQEPELDRLLAEGQRELDFEKRQQIWQAMHRFIYDLQPYMFLYNVPSKYAMSRKIHGYQTFAIDPGYSIRRWYYIDPAIPGTRATRDRQ